MPALLVNIHALHGALCSMPTLAPLALVKARVTATPAKFRMAYEADAKHEVQLRKLKRTFVNNLLWAL